MSDLCDDLESGLGQIDHEQLNHNEEGDGEFLGDQRLEVVLTDGKLFRKRQDVGLAALGVVNDEHGLVPALEGDEADSDSDGVEPHVVYPDYMRGMVLAFGDEQLAAGSALRGTTSRYARRERRSGGAVRV